MEGYVFPGPAFGCSMGLFGFVLYSLWKMAASALRIKDLGGDLIQFPSLRLQAFLATVIGSWLFFPAAIFAGRAGLLDVATAERVLIIANFAAKVRMAFQQSIAIAIGGSGKCRPGTSALVRHSLGHGHPDTVKGRSTPDRDALSCPEDLSARCMACGFNTCASYHPW